jgi:hypothetical protein
MRGKHEFYVLPAAGRVDDAKPIVAACTSREAAAAARRLLNGECEALVTDNVRVVVGS